MKKVVKLFRHLSLMLLTFATLQVSAAQYVEGVDYVKVAGISEVNQPIVREFFSYNCPHCYRQDGLITSAVAKLNAQLDNQVVFERTPVAGGRASWQLSQKAYYLAKKFHVTEQAHGNLFKRIHEGDGAFRRQEELIQFFVAQGLPKADIDNALASVDNKLAIADYDTQAQLSGIRGVPSLLVNGKYLVTNKQRSPEELAELLAYLATLQ
ncbi:thiol:disulfide interchange protein DsbA/DsbL [Shewanella marisflavi]|uniref:thiol:disulfide interchange protein DsbA/DsbL n=1 Tax=Shewanella marisflavi TaxID=260364 RepID=UPI00200BED62|nr:thiol:disulfide interchange protein DsbA/DsbL [Shewanella marisflavi]MCL1043471.1 thiol:disulfide interchange protein DsbA/DsbL [Shewanella marisflavi]